MELEMMILKNDDFNQSLRNNQVLDCSIIISIVEILEMFKNLNANNNNLFEMPDWLTDTD